MQVRGLVGASFVEATTLPLLFFVAMPLKHLAGYPTAVRVMGPAHGLAFLTFVWLAVEAVAGSDWSRRDAIRLFVGAVVPFGGFLNLPFLSRRAASPG